MLEQELAFFFFSVIILWFGAHIVLLHSAIVAQKSHRQYIQMDMYDCITTLLLHKARCSWVWAED